MNRVASKLSYFAYQSPIRQSPRLLQDQEKSPLKINRLESLLETKTIEDSILSSTLNSSVNKSGSRKRSLVCILNDGSTIRLCSACANKNKNVEIIDNIGKPSVKKKTTDKSKTKYALRSKKSIKSFEDTSITNKSAKNISSTIRKSTRAKKNLNDQTSIEATENDTDNKKRMTRSRKQNVVNANKKLDVTIKTSKQKDTKAKKTGVKTRKAVKDQNIQNDINVTSNSVNKNNETINSTLFDSLITRRTTNKIYNENQLQDDNADGIIIFNSTTKNDEEAEEYNSMENDISLTNQINDSRGKYADSLRSAKKRTKVKAKMDVSDELTKSTTKRTIKVTESSSVSTKNILNEISAIPEFNNTGNCLIEDIRCPRIMLENDLNMSNLIGEEKDEKNKRIKSKTTRNNYTLMQSDTEDSDENLDPSMSILLSEVENQSAKSNNNSIKASTKKNKTVSIDESFNVTLRDNYKNSMCRSTKVNTSTKRNTKVKKHNIKGEQNVTTASRRLRSNYTYVIGELKSASQENEINSSMSESVTSSSAWKLDSSDCDCEKCALFDETEITYNKKRISSVGRNIRLKSDVSSSESESFKPADCCKRHSPRRHRAKTKFNLRDLSL